jgi:hypothetical protein
LLILSVFYVEAGVIDAPSRVVILQIRKVYRMDTVTLILTALASGAASSVKDTAGTAVKDASNGLKALIQRKFAGKTKAEAALIDYEDDPETYEKPLKKALIEEHIDQKGEIIAAASNLMTLVQPQQAAMGKYNVQITGDVQGYAQGDNQNVTMNFGNVPEEK